VLGDPRLRTRGYGAMFLRSLPAMPLVEDPNEALAFATELGREEALVPSMAVSR
jgi:hypothetical protein